jgi:hypothetical protein
MHGRRRQEIRSQMEVGAVTITLVAAVDFTNPTNLNNSRSGLARVYCTTSEVTTCITPIAGKGFLIDAGTHTAITL